MRTSTLLQLSAALGLAAASPTQKRASTIASVGKCSFSAAADAGDTCASFSASWGITEAEFKQYNPTVTDCKLVQGTQYCIEWTGGDTNPPPPPPTTTTTTPAPTTTSAPPTNTPPAADVPEPVQDGIIASCNKYHLVEGGEWCQKIVDDAGIPTLDDFYKWNPAVGSSCESLISGYYVCIGVDGVVAVPPGVKPQPGAVSSCNKWHEVKSGENCEKIEKAEKVSDADLRKWNTQIDKGCTNLWLGYSVCVGSA